MFHRPFVATDASDECRSNSTRLATSCKEPGPCLRPGTTPLPARGPNGRRSCGQGGRAAHLSRAVENPSRARARMPRERWKGSRPAEKDNRTVGTLPKATGRRSQAMEEGTRAKGEACPAWVAVPHPLEVSRRTCGRRSCAGGRPSRARPGGPRLDLGPPRGRRCDRKRYERPNTGIVGQRWGMIGVPSTGQVITSSPREMASSEEGCGLDVVLSTN